MNTKLFVVVFCCVLLGSFLIGLTLTTNFLIEQRRVEQQNQVEKKPEELSKQP